MENKTLGVMLDVSRTAVMSIDSLKEFLQMIVPMGYNCLMLYTEDVYELEGEPYFGYMRGRYSTQELRELEAYAKTLGVEIIPCIQTLAHLTAISKWGQYTMDTDDILMVDDESTYKLIEKMFDTLSKCFSTRRIHVGMDEADMLGRGRHLDRYGYETVDALMKRHLGRVVEIAEKYGYEIMIWSDMFFRGWNGGGYYIGKSEMPKAYIDALPQGVIPVYWDYYFADFDHYDAMFYNHAQLSDRTWFAGGAWTWGGFMPINHFSMKCSYPAIKAMQKYDAGNMVVTLWCDDGGECSRYAVLPTLYYVAELMRGNEDMAQIKAGFAEMFGMSFDDFLLLDAPNQVALAKENDLKLACPSKYMLYSDPFVGFMDYTVKAGEGETYATYAQKLRQVSQKSERFGYLFDTAAKLCDVLSYKYELGVKTRAAYGAGDREALKALLEDYQAAEVHLRQFTSALEYQWMQENKPYGLEVQHARLGGLMYRLGACRARLEDYIAGRVASIPELEEEILPFQSKEQSVYYEFYGKIYTANTF